MTTLTLALCLIIFGRLFTYRRNGARYRPIVSLLATLIMASCGTVAIRILAGGRSIAIEEWPILIPLAVLAYALCRCDGNLAHMLSRPKPWAGGEHRKAQP